MYMDCHCHGKGRNCQDGLALCCLKKYTLTTNTEFESKKLKENLPNYKSKQTRMEMLISGKVGWVLRKWSLSDRERDSL